MKRKICIYCDTWTQGGIETFIVNTLQNMDRDDLEITLVCAEKNASRLDESLRDMGLAMQPFLKSEGHGALDKTLGSLLPMYRLCRKERFDIVHLNIFQGLSFLLCPLAKMGGAKCVIAHCHGAGFRKTRFVWLKLLVNRSCALMLSGLPRRRWASSEAAGKFLFGKRPVQIIPNGIDTEKYRFDAKIREEYRKKLGVQNCTVLGCIGRMDAQKNQMYLLPLMQEMKKQRRNDVKLLYFGGGDDRETVSQAICERGLSDSVRLCGVSNEIHHWLSAMDAVLIPSTTEGLSIVAIEAQAAGLPVLCSTGVPNEVKLTDAVQFIPLSEPQKWIQAIAELPAYDRLAMNRQVAQSEYNIVHSAAIVHEAYMQ